MPTEKTPPAPAVERALAILELVATSKSGLAFSQIAKRLPFPRSSVHYILQTLRRSEFLERSESTGRYLCGMKLVSIAHHAMEGIALRDKAGPLLADLFVRTGLTVHMAILDGSEATLVARIDRPGALRVATWIGKRIDVHCTSMGKCLLAYVSDERLEEVVRERGLLRHNENTICSLSLLKNELANVRNLGYAVDDEEEEIGIRCIGAPIFDSKSRVIAAVSVSGTTDMITTAHSARLIRAIKKTAGDITRQLTVVTEHPTAARAGRPK